MKTLDDPADLRGPAFAALGIDADDSVITGIEAFPFEFTSRLDTGGDLSETRR